MVDPAILELMQHLTRPAPAVVREALPVPSLLASASAAVIAGVERSTRGAEQEAAEWIATVERGLPHLLDQFRRTGLDRDALDQFPSLLAELDATVKRRSREFERATKQLRQARKRIMAEGPRFLAAFDDQTERVLRATARRNLALVEATFALRAFYAEASGRGERGVVYTDPDALGGALRAAIA